MTIKNLVLHHALDYVEHNIVIRSLKSEETEGNGSIFNKETVWNFSVSF